MQKPSKLADATHRHIEMNPRKSYFDTAKFDVFACGLSLPRVRLSELLVGEVEGERSKEEPW